MPDSFTSYSFPIDPHKRTGESDTSVKEAEGKVVHSDNDNFCVVDGINFYVLSAKG